MKYRNPIISGYNPDPTICRVGEDYYIANSSFEFFPGVPVYHSSNLVNWELAGYCLTKSSQLHLENALSSKGIYAPTLRYHNGEFFMITTNVSEGKGHLIVRTRDVKGEWSEPVWVEQGGIDPTLLFDGDDVYFASTSRDKYGKQGIFMCKIDPYTGEKLEESVCISYGCGGRNPEGPHLYKWFGKYYLLMAEGGTEYGHMVTLQRADSPYGPYEPCPNNPILTHRDERVGDISCTGHADIVQDHNGNWWLVCLGVRTLGGKDRHIMLHNLGRETFLAPVIWTKDGWPIVGNDGMIAPEMEGPLPGCGHHSPCRDFADDFTEKSFSLHYNYIRNPEKDNYVRDTVKRELLLKGTAVTLNNVASPTWLGIKQKDFTTEAEVKVKIPEPGIDIRVGLTAFYNESYHYEIYVTADDEQTKVCLAKHVHDIFVMTACKVIPKVDYVNLKMTSDRDYYRFLYSLDGEDFTELGIGSTAGLSSEGTVTMTFTGTYIGLFAENGDGVFKDFSVRVSEEYM